MDINKLMSTMLSGDSVSSMSKLTGVSQNEVQSVLSSVLPSLLSGAQGQADDKNTAEGFANALAAHAKVDTSDLASFLSNVDLEDGAKIVSHLLGSQKDSTTSSAAAQAGLKADQAGSVLSAAAPLLMSLMGQQQSKSSAGGFDLGSLLGKTDISKLLSSLLGGK